MSFGALVHLYRVRLRSRIGAELLAVAGIAVGVALVYAALVANTSLTGSVRELSQGIVGEADFRLSARSASGFDQRLLERVGGIPGAAAAPVVEARVNLVGPGGRRSVLLVGADPRFREVGGDLLDVRVPRARHGHPGLLLPAPLAAQLGLAEGERVTVEAGAGTGKTRVAGELDASELGGLVSSPVALAPLPLVQGLAGMRGRVSGIFVAAAPGRAGEVEAGLRRIAGDRLNLGPADAEATSFERAAQPTSRSTALFSALSAVVGFLFALNAMLLTLPQRQRLIADLRMAGFGRAAIAEVLLFDALLLGAIASGLGLLLGEACSRLLFDSVPGYLTSAFAVGSQRIVTWQSALLAAGAGLLAACLAVLVPIRAAISPAAGPERARRRPLLAAAGAFLLGLSAAIGVFAPALSLLAIGTLLLALLLLMPFWLRLAGGVFEVVCRRFRSPVPILAALELSGAGSRSRSLVLAATGAVAVFASVAIGGARADLQRGLDGIAADLDRGAEVWVSFRGPTSIFGTTAMAVPPRQLREITDLDGVRAVSRNRGSFLDVGHDRVWVLAPARGRIGPVLRRQVDEGDPDEAVRRLGRGRGVTVSANLAAELGVGVGERIVLPFPRPEPLRVVALTTNFGWPGGAIAIGASSFARLWGSDAVSGLGIRLEPGARPATVASRVRSILGPRGALLAETSRQRLGRQRAASRAGLSRLDQIAAMVLISSTLAMAASMAALVWQRRPTFAALKVHGLVRGWLWRALLLEGALLLGVGCLLGAGFGLIGQLLLDRALETITGFPVVHDPAWVAAAGIVFGITGAAACVLAVPGWLAVRVAPSTGPAE